MYEYMKSFGSYSSSFDCLAAVCLGIRVSHSWPEKTGSPVCICLFKLVLPCVYVPHPSMRPRTVCFTLELGTWTESKEFFLVCMPTLTAEMTVCVSVVDGLVSLRLGSIWTDTQLSIRLPNVCF